MLEMRHEAECPKFRYCFGCMDGEESFARIV
jgi:hypothetical protein